MKTLPFIFDKGSILEKDFLFKSGKVSNNLGVRLSLQQLAAGGFLNENISKSIKVSIIISKIASALACFGLQI